MATTYLSEVERVTQVLREHMPLLETRFHVESLGVFGSYVHGRQLPNSDLDLLVTFKESPGLIGFLELEHFLSDLLGIRVDLVMKGALRPRIGRRILDEVVAV